MTDGPRLLQAKNGFKKIAYPKYAVGEFDTCFFLRRQVLKQPYSWVVWLGIHDVTYHRPQVYFIN